MNKVNNVFNLTSNKINRFDEKIIITEKHFKRFLSYVNLKSIDECWEWKGTLDTNNYGIFSMNHKLFKAHRFSYHLANNDYNENLMCCHKCDNPRCVNPNHLWQGSQKENNNDRHIKGRTKTGHLYGENNPLSKLKESDVHFIRNNYNPQIWSTRKLAKKFNVSQTKVIQILNHESWKQTKTLK